MADEYNADEAAGMLPFYSPSGPQSVPLCGHIIALNLNQYCCNI